MPVASPQDMSRPVSGPSSSKTGKGKDSAPVRPVEEPFDIVGAYRRAHEENDYPHPLAAIMSLVKLVQASDSSTTTGMVLESTAARHTLKNTQPSLGVQAGSELWELFFNAAALDFPTDVPGFKEHLIKQGTYFCNVHAENCREKIADVAVGFLRDDSTILTHSYSRTVMKTLLKAHKQHKRIKVYVTEAKPNCLGLKTYQELTEAGIPCTVVLDSAVAYVMERVDLVIVGSEAVVESGGLVSAVGTYQIGLIAKALSKPFYALAESYKFLRHYPLSQTDIPLPQPQDPNAQPQTPSNPRSVLKAKARPVSKPVYPLSFSASQLQSSASPHDKSNTAAGAIRSMTQEMLDRNPGVDLTTPDLIDFIITDLGTPLSPTSVSQYLVGLSIGGQRD